MLSQELSPGVYTKVSSTLLPPNAIQWKEASKLLVTRSSTVGCSMQASLAEGLGSGIFTIIDPTGLNTVSEV